MRNVFDQYSQPENQLTHALFSALEHDPALLTSFLREVCRVEPPTHKKIRLSVQKYPFAQSYSSEEIDTRSLPDAWIYTEEGWALVFEAKVTAVLTQKQLNGHKQIATKQGFEKLLFYTIVGDPNSDDFAGWHQLTWIEVHDWLVRKSKPPFHSTWARIAADFFEILEAKMIHENKLGEADITAFSGFLGDDEYTFLCAKKMLKQAVSELRNDRRLVSEIGMNPNVKGRPAITGKSSHVVWDFLSLGPDDKDDFRKFLHLTLGISSTDVEVMVTVPDKISTKPRNAIKELELEGFKKIIFLILKNMENIFQKEPNAIPILSALQRRYPSQRAEPIIDAFLQFDIRTVFGDPKTKPIIHQQHQWIEALFEVFKNHTSNYQFQIGIIFDHTKCSTMADSGALELVSESWIACKPIIDVVRGEFSAV